MDKNSDLLKEQFYSEPPFSYRPSIAEYFATFKVTEKGVIADLLHLDKKRNIEIENYSSSKLEITLNSKEGLNDNELLLWDFLEKKQEGKNAKVNISELKALVKKYEPSVMGNATSKFGSMLSFNPNKIPGGFAIFGFIVSLALSVVGSFLSFFLQIFSLFAIFFLTPLLRGNTGTASIIVGLISLMIIITMPFLIP